MVRKSVFLLGVFSVFLPLHNTQAQVNTLSTDTSVLRSASLPVDGPALVTFFEKRTPSAEKRKEIDDLILQLGAGRYSEREKATTSLKEIGATARPALHRALRNRDPEIRRRSRRILDAIGPASDETTLLPAAARVLIAKAPAEACKVLLAHLPFVEDPMTAEEVARTLTPLASGKNGKPNPLLMAALTDRDAIKRFAAGNALAALEDKDTRKEVRKLLKDSDVVLRRRMALTLLERKDPESIPALISLLKERSEDSSVAENALLTLAGEKAPQVPDDITPATLTTYQKAWEKWWDDSKEKIDLAKLDLTSIGRGFLLVCTLSTRGTYGSVLQMAPSGKIRWRIDNLRYPVSAFLTRHDRVLVAEYYGNKVSERDIKGNVIWEKSVPSQPLGVDRFPTGETFVVTRSTLLLYDRAGNEKNRITRTSDILAAHRFRDGRITLITTAGAVISMDSNGKQTKTFNIGYVGTTLGFRAHFLANGNILVPFYSQRKVKEFDPNGKMVWDLDVDRPSSVVRTANGHVIVASRLRNRIAEYDKNGKELKNYTVDGRPTFVDKR